MKSVAAMKQIWLSAVGGLNQFLTAMKEGRNDDIVFTKEESVSLFEWGEEFVLWHDILDRQHQELVRLINEVWKYYWEVLWEKRVNSEEINTYMTNVFDYASIHFTTEEAQFWKQESEQAHLEEHYLFTEFIAETSERLMDGNLSAEDIRALYIFLKSWLRIHILVTDKAFFWGKEILSQVAENKIAVLRAIGEWNKKLFP